MQKDVETDECYDNSRKELKYAHEHKLGFYIINNN